MRQKGEREDDKKGRDLDRKETGKNTQWKKRKRRERKEQKARGESLPIMVPVILKCACAPSVP